MYEVAGEGWVECGLETSIMSKRCEILLFEDSGTWLELFTSFPSDVSGYIRFE